MNQAGSTDGGITLANRLLAANRPGTSEHQRGLDLLERLAQEPGASDAKWLLGAYFLQVSQRADAHQRAAHWFDLAARQGYPQAIDQLADLSLRGVGAPHGVARARILHQMLADCGYQHSAWNCGYLLGSIADDAGQVDPAAAARAFARACALGYPPAYYSLGLRYALGCGVVRDRAFARALLLRAADGGFPDARAAADELVPDGPETESAQTWHQRLRQNLHAADSLRQRLRPDQVPANGMVNPVVLALEHHFASLAHPSLAVGQDQRLTITSSNAVPYRAAAQPWHWLAQSPHVGISERFATREECAHLVHQVAARLAQPEAYHLASSSNSDAELLNFNGTGYPIKVLETDPVVRELERRIAEIAQWSRPAMEPCSIIRYRPGEEYKPHVDFFTDQQIELNRREHGDMGGQRLATFLVYLIAPEQGGETYYHHADVAVSGQVGSGVLHYNVTPNGVADTASLHSGRPVVRGEKWLWRCALRQFSLYADSEPQ